MNKAAKPPTAPAGIREAEEARALLEKQLHSLYWWVFNACRIKGYLRAKAADEAAGAEPAVSKEHGAEGESGASEVRETR